MTKQFKTILLAGVLLVAGSTQLFAAEKTITLDVENMTCVSCPYQVRKSLERVDGVISAEAILETAKAVVVFEDTITNVAALTEATTTAGYPLSLSAEQVTQTQ